MLVKMAVAVMEKGKLCDKIASHRVAIAVGGGVANFHSDSVLSTVAILLLGKSGWDSRSTKASVDLLKCCASKVPRLEWGNRCGPENLQSVVPGA